VTGEEAKLIEALRKFVPMMEDPGFRVFLDAVRDVMDESNIFAGSGNIRERWTLGEEFAYRLGQKDAALTILALPEKLLTKAQELVQKEKEAPDIVDTPQEAFV